MYINIFLPNRVVYRQIDSAVPSASPNEGLKDLENGGFHEMAKKMRSVIKKPFALEVKSPNELVLTIDYKKHGQPRKATVVEFYLEKEEIMKTVSKEEQIKLLEWMNLNPNNYNIQEKQKGTGKFKMTISAIFTGEVLTGNDAYNVKNMPMDFDSRNPLPFLKEWMDKAYKTIKKGAAVEIQEHTHSSLDTLKSDISV